MVRLYRGFVGEGPRPDTTDQWPTRADTTQDRQPLRRRTDRSGTLRAARKRRPRGPAFLGCPESGGSARVDPEHGAGARVDAVVLSIDAHPDDPAVIPDRGHPLPVMPALGLVFGGLELGGVRDPVVRGDQVGVDPVTPPAG